MHDQDPPHAHDARTPEMAPGEFSCLLREIEKEAVPERLLELARQLQAALVEQRRRQAGEGDSPGG